MATSTGPLKNGPLTPDRPAGEDWLQPVRLSTDAYTVFSSELSVALRELEQRHGCVSRHNGREGDFLQR